MLVHSDGRLGVNVRSAASWRRKDLLCFCSSAAQLIDLNVSAPSVALELVISSIKLAQFRRLRARALSKQSETSDNVIACADRSSIRSFGLKALISSVRGSS